MIINEINLKDENSLFTAETDITADQSDPWTSMIEQSKTFTRKKDLRSQTSNLNPGTLFKSVQSGYYSPGYKNLPINVPMGGEIQQGISNM